MLGSIPRLLKFVLRRCWLRRLICVLVLAPVSLFLISNIILNSKWGRIKLAEKLEQRTGLNWQVETANWTLDGKVHVYEAVAELGDGSLRMEQVDITPNVNDVLDGKLAFSELSFSKPEVDVSLQWIKEEVDKRVKEEARRQSPARPVKTPPVAVVPLPKSPESGQTKPNKPEPVKPEKPTEKPVAQTKPVKPTPVVQVFPEAWIILRDAKFRIRDGQNVVLESGPINGRIPLGGEEKRGFLSCGLLTCLDKDFEANINVPLFWNKDKLVVNEDSLNVLGIHCGFNAEVRRLGNDFSMLARLILPEQEWHHEEMLEGVEFSGKAKKVSGAAILEGRVLNPMHWRGALSVHASDAEVQEYHRGGRAYFDHLRMRAILGSGRLVVSDAAAVSEDLSVLGNGVLQMDGYLYGIVRVLASPDKAKWIDSARLGAELFPQKRYQLMTWFRNKDRKYVDVQLDGMVWNPLMRIEQICEWEPLIPQIKKLVKFVHDEHEEDLTLDLHPRISTKSQK